MSMKNDMTWKFAHLYVAKIWLWSGVVLLAFSTMFKVLDGRHYDRTPGWIIFIEIATMILSIIPTERALLKKFDGKGQLK